MYNPYTLQTRVQQKEEKLIVEKNNNKNININNNANNDLGCM